MALSDEVLRARDKFDTLRECLRIAANETGATAAFLLDEEGNLFAAVGNIELALPNPVASLHGLLSTLVGQADNASPYLVQRATPRALVVLVFESAELAAGHHERAAALASAIKSLL